MCTFVMKNKFKIYIALIIIFGTCASYAMKGKSTFVLTYVYRDQTQQNTYPPAQNFGSSEITEHLINPTINTGVIALNKAVNLLLVGGDSFDYSSIPVINETGGPYFYNGWAANFVCHATISIAASDLPELMMMIKNQPNIKNITFTPSSDGPLIPLNLVVDLLKTRNDLHKLSFSGCGFKDEEYRLLLEVLQNNLQCYQITLDSLTPDIVNQFATLVRRNTTSDHSWAINLDFHNTDIKPFIETLLELLDSFREFNVINLSNCNIDLLNGRLLLDIIRNNHTVTEIILTGNKLSSFLLKQFHVLETKENYTDAAIIQRFNMQDVRINEIIEQQNRGFDAVGKRIDDVVKQQDINIDVLRHDVGIQIENVNARLDNTAIQQNARFENIDVDIRQLNTQFVGLTNIMKELMSKLSREDQ